MHALDSKGNGDSSTKEAFYKNLYSKATDFETERRSIPNPSRLVSFAEMPAGPSSKVPVLAIALALAGMLAGLVASKRNLADRAIKLCFLLLPSRWALWLSA